MASPQAVQPLDTSKLECGICYELLLDPVVGSCGHDFCRICLDKWRSQQRQQGREVRCPVCRGIFAEAFDKLGVCVRLREMVELLFPDKVAARRAEIAKQAAADRKRSASRLQQEDIPPPAVFAAARQTARAGRRRLHARRHNAQAQVALADGSSAGEASTRQVVHTRTGVATATAGAPVTLSLPTSGVSGVPAAGTGTLTGPQLLLNVTANANNSNSNPSGYSISAHQLQQMQAAIAAAAANQLQQFGNTLQQLGPVTWPILDVHFTMGWYDGSSRPCRASARRNRCRRRAARA